MRWKFWTFALGLLSLAGALPATAGGAGPLTIEEVRGQVTIKPLDQAKYWGVDKRYPRSGSVGPVGRWRSAAIGNIVGKYLLRTGPRSRVHLQDGKWCVDANSLLLVDSAADFGITVLRGQVSEADGKRGKRLFHTYRSDM